jgi:hypothetical protein
MGMGTAIVLFLFSFRQGETPFHHLHNSFLMLQDFLDIWALEVEIKETILG